MDSFPEPHEEQLESFLTETSQEDVPRRGHGRRNRHTRRGKGRGEPNEREDSSLLPLEPQENANSIEESTVMDPSSREESALELTSHPPTASSHHISSPPPPPSPPPSPLPPLSEEMPPSPPPSFASIHGEESDELHSAVTKVEMEAKEEPAISTSPTLAPTVLPDARPAGGERSSSSSPTPLGLPDTATTKEKEEDVHQTIPTPPPTLPHSSLASKKTEEQTSKQEARRIRFADFPEEPHTTPKTGTTDTITPSTIKTAPLPPPQKDRQSPRSGNGLKKEEVSSKAPGGVVRRYPKGGSGSFSSRWVLGIAISIVFALLLRVLKRK